MGNIADLMNVAVNGLNAYDVAAAGMRVAVGGFFAISGYHKLFNPARKAKIAEVMKEDHVPCPEFMRYWVPGWEFTGGLMLAAGMFSAFAAGVLAIICVVACACEAKKKVDSYKPIDKADRVDDYLYLPEVLYLVILGALVLGGPGAYRVDALLF